MNKGKIGLCNSTQEIQKNICTQGAPANLSPNQDFRQLLDWLGSCHSQKN